MFVNCSSTVPSWASPGAVHPVPATTQTWSGPPVVWVEEAKLRMLVVVLENPSKVSAVPPASKVVPPGDPIKVAGDALKV